MLDRIFATFPSLEVAVRLAYWRAEPMRKLGDFIRALPVSNSKDAVPSTSVSIVDVIAALRDLGVGEGDILVVHSSFGALKRTKLAPAEIVRALKALVGESGTLAMPAIPSIAGEPEGAAKFNDAAYDRVFDFDVRSKQIVTGALPKALMAEPGALRSRHPGNSMVALGPAAQAMMEGNIDGESPSPCGPNSSWAYCYREGAKIAAIGVDLVHTLTMIHVAEEAFEGWPIREWFRERRFRVHDGDFEKTITIRERRHKWSQHYAERAFSRDLYTAGIAHTRRVADIEIHFCPAGGMVDFLRNHPRPAYPYVFPLGVPGRARK